MREHGVKLAVPLVSQGELIGVINVGNRLSEQEYSAEDQRLLDKLASQTAPALRVAQLVREQELEELRRERLEQELTVARTIQETLLPKSTPVIQGWLAETYWQPARAVGGDFYDFIHISDGQLGLVIGDVADKGVPAALVMATTRSILRATAERINSPGELLEQMNNLLVGDMPHNMFVTCLYAVFDLGIGRVKYANAGHNIPICRKIDGVFELRATGMPLGLIPNMQYEECEQFISPGASVFFYSDGLVEAHNPDREMFGFDRLQQSLTKYNHKPNLVNYMIHELTHFTGSEWEQEDDVTIVTIERLSDNIEHPNSPGDRNQVGSQSDWKLIEEFLFVSRPGEEKEATLRVTNVLGKLKINDSELERISTAVSEATMNAMEHGNKYNPDLMVEIKVFTSQMAVCIRITDHGSGEINSQNEIPNLEAKLAGLQSPRGWGLYLIRNMVDDMNITSDLEHHTIELIFNIKGNLDAGSTV
jgi:serine phosphatase RsbU (regulator of sigma subunit)/anti-sigma regulatory factor (Ser/Thr protein kinase)